MSELVLENKQELLTGWEISTLQEITENHDGERIPVSAKLRKEMKGKYPYYGASGIIDYVNKPIFNGKYLLIGEDGANLLVRKTPIAFIADGKFWVNNHAHVLTTLGNIPLQYLSYFINSVDLSKWISGTTQPKLNQTNMNKIPILIPPLNEQIRIVNKIEELFSELDYAKTILEKTKIQLKQQRQSLLKSAFEGELTQKWRNKNVVINSKDRWNLNIDSMDDENLPKIPNNWCWRTLEQISNGVVVSFVGPTSKHYVEENEGIMFLRSQNVRIGKINFQGMKYVDKDFHEKQKKSQIKSSNLLIVRVGANRGDSCIVPDPFPIANAGNIIIARVFEDVSSLLNYYFQSNFCQKQMIGMTTGSAQGVINTTSVSQTSIPIPSLNEQEEMIRKIEQEFSLIANTENATNSITFQLKTTRSCILKYAFEGKLVPQDPNDEPAEILLQKIKQEKEQSKQKEKSKKRNKNGR